MSFLTPITKDPTLFANWEKNAIDPVDPIDPIKPIDPVKPIVSEEKETPKEELSKTGMSNIILNQGLLLIGAGAVIALIKKRND